MMSRRVAVLVTAASRRSQLRYQKFQHRRQLHYYATSSLSSLSSQSSSQSSSSLSSCSGNKRLMASSSSSSSSSTSTTTSSTVSSITGYLKDIIRTKSLKPINPIIESLPSHENVLKSLTNLNLNPNESSYLLNVLPDFSYIEPHHINDKIIGSIRRQYNVDLASLEVKLASSTTRSAAVANYQSDESSDTNDVADNTNNGAIGTNSSNLSSVSLLLLELDRLQAPVMQLEDISELFTSLASPPDQIEDWYNASDTVYEQTGKLREKLYQSRIIYRALVVDIEQQQQQQNQSSSAFLVPFLKRGCHIEVENDDNDSDNNNDDNSNNNNSQYIEIQNELMILNERLLSIINYEKSSKAMRLQCMSDMYNCIGLTRLQSQRILDNGDNEDNSEDSSSVWNLAKLQHNHMIQDPQKELLDTIYPEITKFLLPHLPKQTKLNLDGVGAFLDSKNQDGSLHSNNKYTMSSMMTEIQRKELLKSKYDFKQRIRLHGAIAGIIDFCDTILGIHVVQQEQEHDDDSKASNKGWNKNVRLLHLYKKQNEDTSDGDDNSTYLGTIYLDLFADSYWRTDEAKELVTSKLFNSSLITSQTIGPCVVMSLKIYPIWDNTPIPITFKDLSQLLYQFGKSIQLLLQQSNIKNKYYSPSSSMGLPEPSPIDTSEVMAHFMEMWILNDGFLNRLAQLSSSSSSSSSSSTEDNIDNANANANDDIEQQQQDEVMLFDDDTLQILRNDYKKEKALQITNTMFLSALQFEVFTIFNPRGDETLVGLQERIANLYLPKSCQPDTSDLSPLLAVFQQSNDSQYMSMHTSLYSNIISANLYEKFQFLLYEARQQEDACKLGIGIRDLFLSSNSNSLRKDIAELLLIGNNNNNNNNRNSATTLMEEKTGEEDGEDHNNSSNSYSIIDDNDTTTTNIISCAPLKRVYQFDKI